MMMSLHHGSAINANAPATALNTEVDKLERDNRRNGNTAPAAGCLDSGSAKQPHIMGTATKKMFLEAGHLAGGPESSGEGFPPKKQVGPGGASATPTDAGGDGDGATRRDNLLGALVAPPGAAGRGEAAAPGARAAKREDGGGRGAAVNGNAAPAPGRQQAPASADAAAGLPGAVSAAADRPGGGPRPGQPGQRRFQATAPQRGKEEKWERGKGRPRKQGSFSVMKIARQRTAALLAQPKDPGAETEEDRIDRFGGGRRAREQRVFEKWERRIQKGAQHGYQSGWPWGPK